MQPQYEGFDLSRSTSMIDPKEITFKHEGRGILAKGASVPKASLVGTTGKSKRELQSVFSRAVCAVLHD